jgi:hypothetical protein
MRAVISLLNFVESIIEIVESILMAFFDLSSPTDLQANCKTRSIEILNK